MAGGWGGDPEPGTYIIHYNTVSLWIHFWVAFFLAAKCPCNQIHLSRLHGGNANTIAPEIQLDPQMAAGCVAFQMGFCGEHMICTYA